MMLRGARFAWFPLSRLASQQQRLCSAALTPLALNGDAQKPGTTAHVQVLRHNWFDARNGAIKGGGDSVFVPKIRDSRHLTTDRSAKMGAEAKCDFGGGLVLHPVTDTNSADALQFMLDDFVHNEPLCGSLSLSKDEAAPFFKVIVDMCASSSISYMLKTPDGQVAAMRLASIIDRPDKEKHEDGVFTSGNMGEKVDKIVRIVGELEDRIWKLVDPRIKRLRYLLILSVGSKFTRRRLAEKLLTYNLEEEKALGCQGCVTEATAFNSQRLFKKLGYEVIYEIRHDKWLDENGERIFKCLDKTDRTELKLKVW